MSVSIKIPKDVNHRIAKIKAHCKVHDNIDLKTPDIIEYGIHLVEKERGIVQ